MPIHAYGEPDKADWCQSSVEAGVSQADCLLDERTNPVLEEALREPGLESTGARALAMDVRGWGISDEQAETFADPRFRALQGVKQARKIVSWDLMSRPGAAGHADRRDLTDWMRGARAAGVEPLVSAGRTRESDTLRAFLYTTACVACPDTKIWLTEQGGLIEGKSIELVQSEAKASGDLRYLLELPKLSDRITRFYIYQWKGDANWDSGLVDLRDRARGVYRVYKQRTDEDAERSRRWRAARATVGP